MAIFPQNTFVPHNNYVYGTDYAIRIPINEEATTIGTVKDEMEKSIKEQMQKINGALYSLQMKTSKAEDFDSAVHDGIGYATKHLENLEKLLKNVQDQIDYSKDLLNGLKVSQELTDGYHKHQEEMNKFTTANMTISGSLQAHTFLPRSTVNTVSTISLNNTLDDGDETETETTDVADTFLRKFQSNLKRTFKI